MSNNDGMILDLHTIRRLRSEMNKLSEDLRKQLIQTDNHIEIVANTWRDEKFISFVERFNEDKVKLQPLSKKIQDFDTQFLAHVQRQLERYLNCR